MRKRPIEKNIKIKNPRKIKRIERDYDKLRRIDDCNHKKTD